MSKKLINYLQERVRLDTIRFNRTSTLLEVLTEFSKLGAKVDPSIVEAAILIPTMDAKRVNLHYKFDMQEIQLYASPKAFKHALQYAALNNPLLDLWIPAPLFSAEDLFNLRTIDTLYAFASELVSDDHVKFAAANGLPNKTQEENYRDLEAKRIALMTKTKISSGDLFVQMIDPQILIYVAWISHQPQGIYTVYGVDEKGATKVFHMTPAQAKEATIEWHQKFTRVHLENVDQRAKIADGSYRKTFQFTPLGNPL